MSAAARFNMVGTCTNAVVELGDKFTCLETVQEVGEYKEVFIEDKFLVKLEVKRSWIDDSKH